VTRPPVRIDTPRVVPPRQIARVRPVELRAMPEEVYGRVPSITPEKPIDLPLTVIEDLSDPTTFRTVLMPTARSIGEGKGFIASYDLAAVVAGYGLSDRITLVGGFLYVPPAISYALDITAGGRYEFYRDGVIRSAAGVQLNYSRSDSSAIALAAPYVVTSLGDDDQRASLVLGYSLRRHKPVGRGTFDRQAIVVGLGGDYRVGQRWKIAAEGYLIQDSDYQPIVVTMRYFGESFALDFGLGINPRLLEGNVNGLGIAPVVSGVWVF
jgi:hypothetical protein